MGKEEVVESFDPPEGQKAGQYFLNVSKKRIYSLAQKCEVTSENAILVGRSRSNLVDTFIR